MDAWWVNARLELIAGNQAGVFSRRQALASGFSADQIVRHLRDGRWKTIRRGQYAENVDLAAMEPWDRVRWDHRQQVHAVMNSLRSGSIAVSHQSALMLHGLPIWGLELSRVHVTRLDGGSGGIVVGVQHHLGKLTEDELAVVDGRLVTSVPRAVVESACTASSFEVAVVSADAALREYRLSDEALARQLEQAQFWPGSTTARAAVRFGSRLSESVGESRLRVLLHDHGLPEPVPQVEFHDRDGFVGRVDFHFPAYDVVLEFDGTSQRRSAKRWPARIRLPDPQPSVRRETVARRSSSRGYLLDTWVLRPCTSREPTTRRDIPSRRAVSRGRSCLGGRACGPGRSWRTSRCRRRP
ncbi:type IV toxin-antitoxin system AbiEi family antitoxin domain-containing protein [Kribbella sp. NPDC051952]|uniref:type IV toxin-antitoxin system AbiEi family antitoxin domain-containing protein n=1 Tax=Kribbella sp. NPDC051952 TaxID=3154851 RepID=UPI003432FABA